MGILKISQALFMKMHWQANKNAPSKGFTPLEFACHGTYLLVSVGLWNFKDGGSLKVRFLAKNQHATKEKSLKNSYE